jgi:hypothetical protein
MNIFRKAAAISAMLILGQTLAATALAQTPDNEGRRICRTTQATHSRMAARRVCRTAAQWRELDRERDERSDANGQVVRESVDSRPASVASPN